MPETNMLDSGVTDAEVTSAENNESAKIDWNRVRRVQGHPFGKVARAAERLIKGCGFRLYAEKDFDYEERSYQQESSAHARPEFRLLIDIAALKSLKVNPDDVRLAIVAKDRLNRRYICDQTLSLRDCPSNWIITQGTLDQIALSGNVEFSIVLALAKPLTRVPGSPWLEEHILAAKAFSVRPPMPTLDFPVVFVPPRYFEDKGLPSDTVWMINMKTDEDFDKPPSEVFEVWINDALELDLKRLEQTNSSDMLLGAILTDITADLISRYVALVDELPPATSANHLHAILAKMVTKGMNLSITKAKGEDPGWMRARVQSMLGLDERIRHAASSGGAQ